MPRKDRVFGLDRIKLKETEIILVSKWHIGSVNILVKYQQDTRLGT